MCASLCVADMYFTLLYCLVLIDRDIVLRLRPRHLLRSIDYALTNLVFVNLYVYSMWFMCILCISSPSHTHIRDQHSQARCEVA